MKRLLLFVSVVLLVVFSVAAGFAQGDEVVAGDEVLVLGAVEDSPLDGVIDAAGGKLGWLAQVLIWIGVLRLTMKPFFTFLHAVVDATPTSRDNEWLERVEGSGVVNGLFWVLDYLASVKVKK